MSFFEPRCTHNGGYDSNDRFVRDILFSEDGYGLIPRVFTESTRKLPPDQQIASTSAKDHLPYFGEIPFVAQYMDFTRLQKLRGTYVGTPFVPESEIILDDGTVKEVPAQEPTGFWKYIHEGRIHPSFLLHRTVTGRTSSAKFRKSRPRNLKHHS